LIFARADMSTLNALISKPFTPYKIFSRTVFQKSWTGRLEIWVKGLATQLLQNYKITITPTATCRPMWIQTANSRCPPEGVARIIVALTDNGSPSMTSYRRIVLHLLAEH
jgi:hypothetical protein